MPVASNSRARRSMWSAISRETSSARASPGRNERRMGISRLPLGGGERRRHHARIVLIARGLRPKLLAALWSEPVELGLAVGVGHAPLLADEAVAFEAMERRVQRPFLHAQPVVR